MDTKDKIEIAVFGGGCFWCTEAVFKMLRGVKSVLPGYAGGTVPNPTYEQVCTGTTGHAEVTRVEYDPTKIPFSDLLKVFFGSHDPTTKDRQGNDVGTQYRSVIFYTTPEQKTEAEKFIADINNQSNGPVGALSNSRELVHGANLVVTELEPLTKFYEAENYHKDYFVRNKEKPYCQVIINPKLKKVQKEFAELLNKEVSSNSTGFIQIPLLVIMLAGLIALGGASYVGVKKYDSYKVESTNKERQMREEIESLRTKVQDAEVKIDTVKNSTNNTVKTSIVYLPPETQERTVLSQVPAPIYNQAPSVTEIVGNWRFFTAKLECFSSYQSHQYRTPQAIGSGLIIKSVDGYFKVLTNKHVVENSTICDIKSPGEPNNVLTSGIIYRGLEDFATISLGNSNDYLTNLISGDAYRGICKESQKPILGDEVLILGYPGAGSQTDVTITKGIISGFEGNYLITDAKINPGNSGGVAISVRDNCYFGIPTYSNLTGFEALGRILYIWTVVGQF